MFLLGTNAFVIYVSAAWNINAIGNHIGVYIDALVIVIVLGFKPRGLKWKGKDVVTTSQLQQQFKMNKRKPAFGSRSKQNN